MGLGVLQAREKGHVPGQYSNLSSKGIKMADGDRHLAIVRQGNERADSKGTSAE